MLKSAQFNRIIQHLHHEVWDFTNISALDDLTNKLPNNAEESGASKLHMVKVEVNKETAWQNRLFLVGKIANPALSFVRLRLLYVIKDRRRVQKCGWVLFLQILPQISSFYLQQIQSRFKEAPQPQFSRENYFSIKNWVGAMAP